MANIYVMDYKWYLNIRQQLLHQSNYIQPSMYNLFVSNKIQKVLYLERGKKVVYVNFWVYMKYSEDLKSGLVLILNGQKEDG